MRDDSNVSAEGGDSDTGSWALRKGEKARPLQARKVVIEKAVVSCVSISVDGFKKFKQQLKISAGNAKPKPAQIRPRRGCHLKRQL